MEPIPGTDLVAPDLSVLQTFHIFIYLVIFEQNCSLYFVTWCIRFAKS